MGKLRHSQNLNAENKISAQLVNNWLNIVRPFRINLREPIVIIIVVIHDVRYVQVTASDSNANRKKSSNHKITSDTADTVIFFTTSVTIKLGRSRPLLPRCQ